MSPLLQKHFYLFINFSDKTSITVIVSGTSPCVAVWCFGETVALRTWRAVGWWHPASLTSMWHLVWQMTDLRMGRRGKTNFPCHWSDIPSSCLPTRRSELGSQPPAWCQIRNRKTPKISTQASGTRGKEREGRGTQFFGLCNFGGKALSVGLTC